MGDVKDKIYHTRVGPFLYNVPFHFYC